MFSLGSRQFHTGLLPNWRMYLWWPIQEDLSQGSHGKNRCYSHCRINSLLSVVIICTRLYFLYFFCVKIVFKCNNLFMSWNIQLQMHLFSLGDFQQLDSDVCLPWHFLFSLPSSSSSSLPELPQGFGVVTLRAELQLVLLGPFRSSVGQDVMELTQFSAKLF